MCTTDILLSYARKWWQLPHTTLHKGRTRVCDHCGNTLGETFGRKQDKAVHPSLTWQSIPPPLKKAQGGNPRLWREGKAATLLALENDRLLSSRNC